MTDRLGSGSQDDAACGQQSWATYKSSLSSAHSVFRGPIWKLEATADSTVWTDAAAENDAEVTCMETADD